MIAPVGGMTFPAKPWLVLCEGDGDRHVFSKIVEKNGQAAQFCVRFPGTELSPQTGGIGKIGAWLAIASSLDTFKTNIKTVLVLADADDDRAKTFGVIKSVLENNGLPAPAAERQLVKVFDWLELVVQLVPMAGAGNIETLALPAAYEKWPIKAALDQYVAATPAAGWGVGLQSKMRMQALIAANCDERPETNFKQLWQKHERYHLPLNHGCFAEVTDFLRNFEAFLQAARQAAG